MTNSTNRFQDVVIADFERKRGGAWRVRLFWFAGVFTAFVFALGIVAGWHIIVTIAPYILVVVVLLALLFAVVFVYEFVEGSKTRHKEHDVRRRTLEAQAQRAEAEARAASFFVYSRSEGVIQHSAHKLNVLALPASTNNTGQNILNEPQNSFDFFELMTQVRKAYAIFGHQQVGKTTMVHHLVRHWQDRDVMPVVIGQKFDAHEYNAGVMKFGPDKKSIVEGFNLVRQEAEARQKLASEGQSFGEMTPLPVILEDATSLNAIVDAREFEQFMRQLLTIYAAKLIVVYLVVHGMDLASFGLKVGAALKNQLTCLYFDVPPYLATFTPADVVITASIGYRPQEAERYPVTGIPAGFATLIDNCRPALYSLAVDIPKVQMSNHEHKILRLYGQDWTISQIAEHIYGVAGSHNNGKVKDVLAKYGIPVRDARIKEFEVSNA